MLDATDAIASIAVPDSIDGNAVVVWAEGAPDSVGWRPSREVCAMQRPPRGQILEEVRRRARGLFAVPRVQITQCCHGSGYFARGMRRDSISPTQAKLAKFRLRLLEALSTV